MFENQSIGAGVAVALLLLTAVFIAVRSLRKFAYTAAVLAAVAIALTFPNWLTSYRGYPLSKLIVPLLQIITFGVGCTMSWRDLAGVFKTPRAVFIGVVCHYAIMPLVALTIARAFGFPPEIAAGVVLVGCCPSGLASNVIALLARANLALSVTITTISTLLAPVFTPLLMKALGGQFIYVSAPAMFLDILKLIIVPIVAGVVFHHFAKDRAAPVMKIMPVFSMIGVALIIAIITAAGRNALLHVGAALLIAMFLHMTVGFTLGYLGARLLRLPEADCRTISIEVGMQNGGLASGIAAQMGKIATVGLAPAVNGPVMNVTFSLLGSWWGKRPPNSEAANPEREQSVVQAGR